jgi:hypothetical protein
LGEPVNRNVTILARSTLVVKCRIDPFYFAQNHRRFWPDDRQYSDATLDRTVLSIIRPFVYVGVEGSMNKQLSSLIWIEDEYGLLLTATELGFERRELMRRQVSTSLNGGILVDILAGVSDVGAALQDILSAIDGLAGRIDTVTERLNLIAATLQKPYESKANELRSKAEEMLLLGMKTTGRDRTDNLGDALRLFANVLENPIGRQDHVARFKLGWLQWKYLDNIVDAADSFYHAQRLSALTSDDDYHLISTRHVAHMLYLQGKYDKAYDELSTARTSRTFVVPRGWPSTMEPAERQSTSTFDVCMERSRYAARSDKQHQRVIPLLDECFSIDPIQAYCSALSHLTHGDYRGMPVRRDVTEFLDKKKQLSMGM